MGGIDDADLCFPSEFPYEYESSLADSRHSSPVESVACSAETESSEEDDFLAGLTRRMYRSSLFDTRQLVVPVHWREKPEKRIGLAMSPQSTLTGVGSWSGRSFISNVEIPSGVSQFPSPFVFKNNWDMMSAVVGEVARMKINGGDRSDYGLENRGLLGNPLSVPKNATTALCENLRANPHVPNGGRIFVSDKARLGHPEGFPQSSWPVTGAHHRNLSFLQKGSSTGVDFRGRSGVRRECAGTGVFLPRQYGSHADSRKKSSCSPVLQAPKVVHHQNSNLNAINGYMQPRFFGSLSSELGALLGMRNGVVLQQSTKGTVNLEASLPQEWTY